MRERRDAHGETQEALSRTRDRRGAVWLGARVALAALACSCVAASRAVAALANVSIDQTPILRVLRATDVPDARNQELPSGALTAAQFAFNDNAMPAARREEQRLLEHDGFRSSAISEFYGPGRLQLKSAAIELRSPELALRALGDEAKLAARTQAPLRDDAGLSAERAFAHARLVTFTPPVHGWAGGIEILVAEADYLYVLQAVDKPDDVSRQSTEALLRTVIAGS